MPRETNSVPGFYFKVHPLDFGGEPSNKKSLVNRYISAEIEVANAVSAHKLMAVLEENKCSTVTDGSLDNRTGFEINTAPRKGEAFPELIEKICGALKEEGGKVSEECGLHIHVDTRDLSPSQLIGVIKLYSHVEPALFALQPESRRGSRNCEPFGDLGTRLFKSRDELKKENNNSEKHLEALIGAMAYNLDNNFSRMKMSKFQNTAPEFLIEDFEKLKEGKYNGRRYKSLGIPSHFHRGTVECRLHCGTINAKEIVNWGLLIGSIVDKGAKLSEEQVDSLEIPKPSSYSYFSYGTDTSLNNWVKNEASWKTLLDFAPYGTKYYLSSRKKKMER